MATDDDINIINETEKEEQANYIKVNLFHFDVYCCILIFFVGLTTLHSLN